MTRILLGIGASCGALGRVLIGAHLWALDRRIAALSRSTQRRQSWRPSARWLRTLLLSSAVLTIVAVGATIAHLERGRASERQAYERWYCYRSPVAAIRTEEKKGETAEERRDEMSEEKAKPKKRCPRCGAAAKYPTIVEERYGMRREYPTTYVCGTIDSPNWSPPLVGRECVERDEAEPETEGGSDER